MLKQIKEKTGLKVKSKVDKNDLCTLLGKSEPTIHAWENNNTWPKWALEKCGFKIVACT